MKTSLRSKLISLIASLIVVVLGLNAAFLIVQKNQQGRQDLTSSAVSYASLSHKVIGDAHALYGESGFVNLKNIINKQLSIHPDVRDIKIISYTGDILFESSDKAPKTSFLQADTSLMPAIQGRFNEEQNIIGVDNGFDLIYPYYDDFENHNLSMLYTFSYDRINKEIQNTILIIVGITAAAIIAAVFIGFFFASGITRPLKKVMQGARDISGGDYSTQIDVASHDETRELADTFNQMAKDLFENTEELKVKERLQEEMALAGKIQQDTIPKATPELNGIEITASVEAAEDVGGDVYDFIKIDDNKAVIYLGDATGHGIPAGLIVAIANALIFHHANTGKGVAEIIAETNKVLYVKSGMDMFITMAVMMWDAKQSILSLAMAGHEQILSFKPGAKEIELLAPGGMAVGMIEDVGMITKEEEIKVEEGQVLAIYSDGIPEAWAPGQKEIYGMDRFMESFHKHCSSSLSLQEIHDAILKDVRDFMQDAAQEDDITMMLLRFKKDIKVVAKVKDDTPAVKIKEPDNYN